MRAGRDTLRRSFLWLGSASVASRIIDLAAIVVVLRFVSAADVGAAAAAWTITTLLEPFASLGVNFALVTLRRLDRRTLDTAFWLSCTGGFALAGAVAFFADGLGAIFSSSHLGPVVAVGGLKLIPVGLAAVPQQRLARGLHHRELAAASACATVVSACTRVVIALFGGGVWAFVFAQHAHALTLLVCTWALVPLKPRLRARTDALRTLLSVGLPSSAATSVALLARNLDMLFVSRWFGLEALGLYRVAFDLAMGPLVAIGDVVARSAAPTLRRLFREPGQLRATFAYSVRLSLLVCAPIALITFSFAPMLLTVAKDPSFVAAAPAARVLVMAAILLVVFGLYNPLAQALGHPELGLWSNLELLVLLTSSLWLCLSLLGPFLSIAAAGIAWCLALSAALLLTRHRFRRAVRTYPVGRPSSALLKSTC